MYKLVLLFVALALFAQGAQCQSDNNGTPVFETLFSQEEPNQNAAVPLADSVESLQKPDGDDHMFDQAVSSFSSWSNDNGKVTKHSGGSEITDDDGKITRREFTS